MIALAFAITTVGILLAHCTHLFFISKKRRAQLVAEGGNEAELRHNNEHLAGVVLMFFCGLLIEAGLILVFIDRFFLGIHITPALFSYLSFVFGCYVIANSWYVVHLKREESGFFEVHDVHSTPSECGTEDSQKSETSG